VDVTVTGRALTGIALLGGLVGLSGCGDSSGAAPQVTLRIGGQEVLVDPTQYCLDGEGQRYEVEPPVVGVAPDSPLSLTVPEGVAAAGWSVQVYDEHLVERLGEVDVPPGTVLFDAINSSDVVPSSFYLVVVEDADPDACSGLSGAWPIGFIRAGADGEAPATTTPTS
jgi:hypothetical protein